jgi:hypothetical protein
VLGRMVVDGKIDHRIQTMANVSKDTKDKTGAVKKTMNFNTRMRHLDITKMPETIPADLGVIIRKIEEKSDA